jgi:hypothetical protein
MNGRHKIYNALRDGVEYQMFINRIEKIFALSFAFTLRARITSAAAPKNDIIRSNDAGKKRYISLKKEKAMKSQQYQ